jgi:hypothetical protein
MQQVTRHVCAMGEISRDSVPVVSPLPIDAEERAVWTERLVGELTTTGARELAYVIAYVLTVGDLELAPIEGTWVEELRRAMFIEDSRARELVAMVASLLTLGAPTSDVGLSPPAR